MVHLLGVGAFIVVILVVAACFLLTILLAWLYRSIIHPQARRLGLPQPTPESYNLFNLLVVGAFIRAVFVLVCFTAASFFLTNLLIWLYWSIIHLQARLSGLPQSTLVSYNPFNNSSSYRYGAPRPATSSIVGPTNSTTMAHLSGAFIIVIFVLVYFAAACFLFTNLLIWFYWSFLNFQNRQLGLPQSTTLVFYNPFNNSFSQYGAPRPSPGGIMGWVNDRLRSFKNRNSRSADGAYEKL